MYETVYVLIQYLFKPPYSMAYHAKPSVNENLPERSLKGMLRGGGWGIDPT